MFTSLPLVVAFLFASAMASACRAAAAPTDDLFMGTLAMEQGQPVLTRCDAVANRYRLLDRRADKSRPLSAFATPRDDVFDVIGTVSEQGNVTTLTVEDISARTPRPMCHLDEVDAMFADDAPQRVDPAERYDLAALLECRSEVATADRFRNWLMLDPATLAAAGLTRVKGHAFLAEFRLATPLTVFGHQTSVLALHPSGVLTVLADVTPQALAKTLDVPTMLGGDPFIAQRVIATSPGPTAKPGAIAARVLVVTSREGLAGKAVAGCLYYSTGNGGL